MAEAGGTPSLLPLEVTSPVLEVEDIKVTKELRARMLFLRHLPLHSTVKLVELDMSSIVSRKAMDMSGVSGEITRRAKRRKSREKSAAKDTKKGEMFLVSQADHVAAMKARHEERQRQREAVIGELFAGPALGMGDPNIVEGEKGIPNNSEMGVRPGPETVEPGSSPSVPISSFSFATIAGEGHFPALGGAVAPSGITTCEEKNATDDAISSASDKVYPPAASTSATSNISSLTAWGTAHAVALTKGTGATVATQVKSGQNSGKGRKKLVLSGFL